MRTLPKLFAIWATLLLSACAIDGEVVETVNYGDYFLVNTSSVDLKIEAENRALLVNTVPVGQTAHFYTMIQGTGGHVFPSNAFTEFQLLTATDGAETVVYSAVNNEDWEEVGYTEAGHAIINLVVTDELLDLP